MISSIYPKPFVFVLVLIFFGNEISQCNEKVQIERSIIKEKFKKNQLIEFTLKDNRIIIIQYIGKGENTIKGKLVEVENGKYKVKNKTTEIDFQDIVSYNKLSSGYSKKEIFGLVLVGVVAILFMIAIQNPIVIVKNN